MTSDDREGNVVSVREDYVLPDAALQANGLKADFPLKADVSISDLPTPSTVDRRMPIALGRPIFREHKTKVSNLQASFVAPDDARQRNRFFWFDLDSTSTPTEFDVEWRLMTLSDRVPLENIDTYKQAVDKASRNIELRYDFTHNDKPADKNSGG